MGTECCSCADASVSKQPEARLYDKDKEDSKYDTTKAGTSFSPSQHGQSPPPTPSRQFAHLKFTFHERLGPLEILKQQAEELQDLEFVTDLQLGRSMYTGYMKNGLKHGLGEELLESGDVYEGEYRNGE